MGALPMKKYTKATATQPSVVWAGQLFSQRPTMIAMMMWEIAMKKAPQSKVLRLPN